MLQNSPARIAIGTPFSLLTSLLFLPSLLYSCFLISLSLSLSPTNSAPRYCRMTYDPNHEESREVYLCLFKMYLSPPNMEEFGIRVPEGSQPEASVDDALRVLMAHHSLIDTAKVYK